MVTLTIDVDRTLDELTAGNVGKEEYERNVKNAIVLAFPSIDHEDVNVQVASGEVLAFMRDTDENQNNVYVFKKQDGEELRLNPNITVSGLQNRL